MHLPPEELLLTDNPTLLVLFGIQLIKLLSVVDQPQDHVDEADEQ